MPKFLPRFRDVRNAIGKLRTGSAFTLVELIVVITILAILATVGFLTLSGYTDDARSATVAANVRTVYSAILTESTTSGNSPRYYVDHDPAAALSGGIVFVDGGAVALTGGQWGSGGTNYSAGNPRWDRLKMNGDKFRLSAVLRGGLAGANGFGGLPGAFGVGGAGFAEVAGAAYDTGAVSVGAFDYVGKAGLNGRARTATYFQVAGVSPGTKKASVTGNYMAAGTGAVLGLVDDPSSTSSTGAIVDSAVVNGGWSTTLTWTTCNAIKIANPSAASGTYSIDPDGSGPNAPFNAYCDMTTDGGGWMAMYTSSWTIHLNTELATSTTGTFGTNGFRAAGGSKTVPFSAVMYVNHDTGVKYVLTRNDATQKAVNTYGIPYNEDQAVTWKITSPTSSTLPGYDFNLMICDGVWMQTGFMFTGVYASMGKLCGNWENDTSTWYFRHDGDYSPDNGTYHGVAFAENGHSNRTTKLVSVLIR